MGDNYLLTVLAALSEKPNFIPNLFTQKRYTAEGIFTIKVFVKGRPEDITVDDYFPVYSHQPAFAKPTIDGGWWIPLIEKAFAKVHVNYEMISSGTQAEAARFLTGAPAEEFQNNIQTSEEVLQQLQNAVKEDYLVTAASFNEWNGLVNGHGYIVKNVYTFKKSDGSETHIVKMRNPFKIIDGSQHWTGRYGADDHNSWSNELKTHVEFDSLKPGEFFMTIDDFK